MHITHIHMGCIDRLAKPYFALALCIVLYRFVSFRFVYTLLVLIRFEENQTWCEYEMCFRMKTMNCCWGGATATTVAVATSPPFQIGQQCCHNLTRKEEHRLSCNWYFNSSSSFLFHIWCSNGTEFMRCILLLHWMGRKKQIIFGVALLLILCKHTVSAKDAIIRCSTAWVFECASVSRSAQALVYSIVANRVAVRSTRNWFAV